MLRCREICSSCWCMVGLTHLGWVKYYRTSILGKNAMKKLLVPLVVVLGMLFSHDSFAARSQSMNTIWFDSSGNVIGQDAYFCNNVHWKGGAQSGAYRMIVRGGCGDPIISCDWVSNGVMCTAEAPYYDYSITSTLSGNYAPRTMQEVCDVTGACTFTEPELMYGWGFELYRVF